MDFVAAVGQRFDQSLGDARRHRRSRHVFGLCVGARLTFGTEYALPLGGGRMASLFAQGRVGEGDANYGGWGGLTVYFGRTDKSLIRRHREDDPATDTGPEGLGEVTNALPNATDNDPVVDPLPCCP